MDEALAFNDKSLFMAQFDKSYYTGTDLEIA